MALRSLAEINSDFLFAERSSCDNSGYKTIFIDKEILNKDFLDKDFPDNVYLDIDFSDNDFTDQNFLQKANLPPKSKIVPSQPHRQLQWPKWRKARCLRNKPSMAAILSDTLFYLAILVILITTIFAGAESGAPRVIMGYSYFTVLTTSMQDVIPKGSFILVQKTDQHDLQLGDNITYMRDASTSVTHQIVAIYENYQNSGSRGFLTQGVNNINPDRDIVFAENVVGKVVTVLPVVGAAILYLRANIYLVFVVFGLFVIFSFSIRGLLLKQKRYRSQKEISALHKTVAS